VVTIGSDGVSSSIFDAARWCDRLVRPV